MGRLAGTVARACLTVGIALMAAALARAEPAAAADLTVEQIEKIVRDYLLREPEVVYRGAPGAAAPARRRRPRRASRRQSPRIRAICSMTRATPVGGNPDGDVTLVEFFDYRCAYCRRVVASVRALLDEDPSLRVVFKDAGARPGFGAGRARGIGEPQAGRLLPFHFALMASDDLSLAGIRAAAKGVGLDPDGSRPTWKRPRSTR